MKQSKEQIVRTSIPIFWLVIIFALGLVVGILIGIMIGMAAQQMILFKGIEMIAPTFDGIEVNIDLNETAIVNGLSQVAEEMQQSSGDPHNINIDATCPGRNTTKTVLECIREVEYKSLSSTENCTGIYCQ